MGGIQIRCSVPARPNPTKPGESRNGLSAQAVADDVSDKAAKHALTAEVNPTGGGSDGEQDWVLFYVRIPLKPAELDAEAHRYLTKFLESAKVLGPNPELATTEAQQRALRILRDLIYQSRTGHFVVKCSVMNGNEVIGVGTVELKVLFKGRFSDIGLPGAAPS